MPIFLLTLCRLAHADAPEPWVVQAVEARVHIPAEGDPTVDLTYELHRVRPGWSEVRLTSPALTVLSAEGPVAAGPGGLYAVLGPSGAEADVTVHVRGLVQPTSPGALCVDLPMAAGERVTVDAPGFDVRVDGLHGDALTPTGHLVVGWNPHVAEDTSADTTMLLGQTAVAAWAEEGALLTRSRVRWNVARGETDTFHVDLAGLDEVEISGANLRSWEREGSGAVLHAKAAVRGSFAVEITGRAALPTGQSPVPAPRPTDTRRNDRFWTLGRSAGVDLVPVGGPRSVALRSLPPWARGIADTQPLAAWEGDQPLLLQSMKYEPLMGPDTVVESAEFVLATSAEGRELLRSTWLVRNERRQYLHLRPSDGYTPMTARVSGRPVTGLSDGEGGLYVPLEKSVETVQGLVSFPVEVTWIATHAAWGRSGERTMALPSVDAPIESVAWELHLPRDVEPTRRHAETEPAPVVVDPAREAARNAWLNAMNAYKNNDFQAAQGYLDDARTFDSSDQNIGRLQSNLDVLLGSQPSSGETSPPEDELTRRVRDLANAKTATVATKQAELEEEAKKATMSGDAEKAADYWEQVAELADAIGVTEQKENGEQADKKAEAVEQVKQAKAKIAAKKGSASSGSLSTSGKASGVAGYGWEDSGVTGGVVGGVVNGTFASEADDDEPLEVTVDPVTTLPVTTTGTTTPVSDPQPDVSGNAMNENTYVLDGVNETDPVTWMFSMNMNYDAVEQVRTSGPRRGHSRATVAEAPPPPPAPPPVDGPYRSPPAATTRAPAKPAPMAAKADEDRAGEVAPVEAAPVEAAAVEVDAKRSDRSEARGPGPRKALEVSASPFTPALPLDGATVRHADALLPAGATPTFTVRYRTRSGAR